MHVLAGGAVLAPSAMAQAPAAKQDALVGTWVKVVDTSRENWKWEGHWRGHLIVQYLTLNANGTYMSESQVDGRRDTMPGGFVYVPWGWPERQGKWALQGDTLKFGSDGQYSRYRAAIGEPTLTLMRTAWWTELGDDHHAECRDVFTRFDSVKPLPPPTPRFGECQTVAGPLPRMPMPKPSELLGTWAYPHQFQGWGPYCKDKEQQYCTVTVYDTLTLRADSTMVHTVIQQSPAHPAGEVDGTAFPKLRWWIASDTLWIRNAVPINPALGPAKPWPMTSVWFEDGGRYLHVGVSDVEGTYHRVPTAP